MHNSPPINRRLLGEDARNTLKEGLIASAEDRPSKKTVTVIERNRCCQGCKCKGEDRTVFLILFGVVLMSLAYFFLRKQQYEIKLVS